MLFAQNRIEELFQFLRMTVGRDPRNVEAHIALANLYRTQGTYQRAMDEVNEALKREPDNVRALYELAASQALAQQTGNAEATLRHALRLAPNDTLVLLGLTRVLLRKGSLDEAEAMARKASRIEPRNADALIAISLVLARKQPAAQHREEALALLRQAGELDRGRVDVPWQVAQIETAAGNWRAAIPELQTVVRADPDRAQVYFLLARAYRSLNRAEEARVAEVLFHQKEQYAKEKEALSAQLTANPRARPCASSLRRYT